ncbi:MAG: hypothetical protein MUO63_14995, partial [Desulfobulbaceae bacterium]|nr:hypothetical protein [Desulfobulbaceae bacterium]
VVESLQNRTLSFQSGPESRKKEHSHPLPVKEIRFYPSVPDKLPDLNEGYLFNQERQLKLPETIEGAAADDTLAIDMDEVRYAGSVISGSTRKGLIRYPVVRTPMKRGARAIIAKRATAEKWSSKVVEEGETVSGYRVVSISPQAIVFEQGDRQLEKKLYTPDKERIAFTPPMNRSKPVKKRAARKTTKKYPPATSARSSSTNRVKRPITTRSTVRN